jgi:glycosyltransferase involved in cell wall biosynthesis
MRIAQVAPLWEEVPPKKYGGTERIVSYLTEELVRLGHNVVLFASGDSATSAQLESVWPVSFRKTPPRFDPSVLTLAHVGKALEDCRSFDIIHNHLGVQAFPLLAASATPSVTTVHDGFTKENLVSFEKYPQLPVVSISKAQRDLSVATTYQATVYHGLPMDEYPFSAAPDTTRPYLAFLGRMSAEKAPHLAIETARRSGWRLKMAAKIANHEVHYWKACVEPLVDGDQIQYLGELGHAAKTELIGGAAALLFPIQWKEPFGLVMIESLACGTPVLAFRNGSVPEVIRHGDTGFVVNSVDNMVRMTARISELSREECRADVRLRFSDHVMAKNYLTVYNSIIDRVLRSNQQVDEEEAKFAVSVIPWDTPNPRGHQLFGRQAET